MKTSGAIALLLGFILSAGGDPLDQWSWRHPLPTGNSLSQTKFLNGSFITVGEAGTILTSSNGVVWETRTSRTSTLLADIEFGNGVYVAVGSAGTILRSVDRGIWSLINSGTTNHLKSIVFGNGVFIVLGTDITLASADGILWQEVPGPRGAANIAFGNGVFVAVPGSQPWVSTNGQSWSTNGNVPYSPKMVAFGQNKFVLLAFQYQGGPFGSWFTRLLHSSDGVNWTVLSWYGGASFPNAVGAIVGSGNNGFLVSDAGNNLWGSNDGVTWTNTGAFSSQEQTAAFGNGQWVRMGSGGFNSTSPDAVVWTTRSSNLGLGAGGLAASSNVLAVAGRDSGAILGQIAISINDEPFTTNVTGQVNDLVSVAFGNSAFVAVGAGGRVSRSTNAFDWAARPSQTGRNLRCVGFGSGGFVAAGD